MIGLTYHPKHWNALKIELLKTNYCNDVMVAAKIIMITRIVVNHVPNQRAADFLIEMAGRTLGQIPGIIAFNVGKPIGCTEPADLHAYAVGIMTCFSTMADVEKYLEHGLYKEWMRVILHGYKLKGTRSKKPEEEIVEEASGPNKRTVASRMVRNKSIPRNEVAWISSIVTQFGNNS